MTDQLVNKKEDMMPKKPEQFETMREESRNKILQSALELFANQGFHQTSIAEIAKNANTSKGLIYNYFESKTDLLNTIVLMGFSHDEHLITDFPKGLNASKKMRFFIETTFDMFENQKEFYKLYSSIIMQPAVLENSHELITQVFNSMFSTIEEILKELGYENPKIEAKILGATIDGVAIHYFFEEDKYPLGDVKNQLIQNYCKEQN